MMDKLVTFCDTLGFHVSEYEDICLLGCWAV
jgi:hypothetical protein